MPLTLIIHPKVFFASPDLQPGESAGWDVVMIQGEDYQSKDCYWLRVMVYDIAHNLSFGKGVRWANPAKGYATLPALPKPEDYLPYLPDLLVQLRAARAAGKSDAEHGQIQARYLTGPWGPPRKDTDPVPEPIELPERKYNPNWREEVNQPVSDPLAPAPLPAAPEPEPAPAPLRKTPFWKVFWTLMGGKP